MSSPPVTGRPYLDDVLQRPGAVLAFAHRGGAEHPEVRGLENTLAAFRHAHDLGYRWLETDVHLTRDGVLVAFHDARLDRVTDSRGRIADLDRDAVRAARVGGREPVPTLAELVAALPDARFNVDLKADAAVGPLARFIREHGLEDRVMVGSFSPARLHRFRRLTGGDVATSAHPGEVALFVGAAGLRAGGRLGGRLVADRVAALQVPHRHLLRGRQVEIVNRRFVERAHAVGLHVHVWTIDDPAQMHHLLDLGVDGLMTDRTDLLRQVLEERGQWWGA